MLEELLCFQHFQLVLLDELLCFPYIENTKAQIHKSPTKVQKGVTFVFCRFCHFCVLCSPVIRNQESFWKLSQCVIMKALENQKLNSHILTVEL